MARIIPKGLWRHNMRTRNCIQGPIAPVRMQLTGFANMGQCALCQIKKLPTQDATLACGHSQKSPRQAADILRQNRLQHRRGFHVLPLADRLV